MKALPLFLCAFALATTSCAQSSNSKNNEFMKEENTSKIDSIRADGYVYDSFKTSNGRCIDIVFIKHGSLIVNIDNYLVYIDPVTMYGNDFSKLPKADMIAVTHEHHDHFDTKAIELLNNSDTRFIGSAQVVEKNGNGSALLPGDTVLIDGKSKFTLIATHAYNNTAGHQQYHPKERQDIGFVFDIDGFRIYIAGDTEDIEEMGELTDIDVAFLPVNQPYTMTPEQAIRAVEIMKPRIVYPYHFGETDLTPISDKFSNGSIDIRIRELQ